MTSTIYYVNTIRPDFMEPLPVVLVQEVSTEHNSSHLVNIGTSSFQNIQTVVNKMFGILTVKNISFEFNPQTASWNCSYFPADYITPVDFIFFLRQHGEWLMFETVFTSGNRESFNQISNSVVGELHDENNHRSISRVR